MNCSLTTIHLRRGRSLSWIAAALAAATALAPAATVAQALISPVLVEFKPKQKITTLRITLSDQATSPMRLQAQLLRWRQDAHGAPVTQPSDDLVVTPRIADLKPGQQQVLRLALRGSLPAETEMAYRLVLEDIADPKPMDMGGGAAVNFRMAYDLPVLVAPRGPIVKALRWRDCDAPPAPRAARGRCVRIVNAGNTHVKVQSLTVDGDGWQQSLDLREGAPVLAGDEREWTVPTQASGPIRSVQVRTSAGAVLQAAGAVN
jgi:fimbrial chaperone protein